MGVLSRFRRRKSPYQAVTDEERMARYIYLLNTLPASVIESAHATAFKDLPAERRREMFEQLRPFMSDAERATASDDPIVLARLIRRAEEHRAQRAAASGRADAATPLSTGTLVSDDPRDAVDSRNMLLSVGVGTVVANQFLLSGAVALYFTSGAGSLTIAGEPGWVGETYDPGFSGGDGGFGGGGGDYGGGGGFDGGGFGGGFDGGGFGGGDGGGGG